MSINGVFLKYICDRCGKEEYVEADTKPLSETSSPSISIKVRIQLIQTNWDIVGQYLLCPKCLKEFEEFIKNER